MQAEAGTITFRVLGIPEFAEYYIPVTESGCWLWLGYLRPDGRAQISVNGKMMKAHRFSYELHKGPIAEDMTIDHLCRVPCCVNPDHLEPVTIGENLKRRDTALYGTCKQGHLKTPDNVYLNAKYPGRKKCRICQLANMKRYQGKGKP